MQLCLLIGVLHSHLGELERKFVLLANWRIIVLRTKMKMLCGSPPQTFCHWLMELHEHCCEMESMMVFCSLSPFIPSSTLCAVLLTNLSFGYYGLSWWRRVSVSMFLGAVTSYKLYISGFLVFRLFWYVGSCYLAGVACIRWQSKLHPQVFNWNIKMSSICVLR